MFSRKFERRAKSGCTVRRLRVRAAMFSGSQKRREPCRFGVFLLQKSIVFVGAQLF